MDMGNRQRDVTATFDPSKVHGAEKEIEALMAKVDLFTRERNERLVKSD
jgi:hypothetical protein